MSAETVTLARTAQLERFLQTAAGRGLCSQQALRLAIERALVLIDAEALGLDRGAASHLLCALAASASVHRPLSGERAVYVRRLGAGRPEPTCEIGPTFTVKLPPALIERARGVVSPGALSEDAVEEMIAWELAATLDGRTMSEWALLALGRRQRAAAV
jgi:hypothetical protein